MCSFSLEGKQLSNTAPHFTLILKRTKLNGHFETVERFTAGTSMKNKTLPRT